MFISTICKIQWCTTDMKMQQSGTEFGLFPLESEGAQCMTKNSPSHSDQSVVLDIIIVLTAFGGETPFRHSGTIWANFTHGPYRGGVKGGSWMRRHVHIQVSGIQETNSWVILAGGVGGWKDVFQIFFFSFLFKDPWQMAVRYLVPIQ